MKSLQEVGALQRVGERYVVSRRLDEIDVPGTNSTLKSNRDPARTSALSTGQTVSAVVAAGQNRPKPTLKAQARRLIVMTCSQDLARWWTPERGRVSCSIRRR